jgi:hypothetical protein
MFGGRGEGGAIINLCPYQDSKQHIGSPRNTNLLFVHSAMIVSVEDFIYTLPWSLVMSAK